MPIAVSTDLDHFNKYWHVTQLTVDNKCEYYTFIYQIVCFWLAERHMIKINITRWITKPRPNKWWNLATADIAWRWVILPKISYEHHSAYLDQFVPHQVSAVWCKVTFNRGYSRLNLEIYHCLVCVISKQYSFCY